MADPGEGGPPKFSDETEARKVEKNLGGGHLSKGLDDCPLPLSQGLDAALTSKNQTTFFILQHMIM